ncbi:MAG TPA: PadR family transcriptional regulator [Propionibacteriaceae bacterium]|nr:PadR family transcriptional regulator [Propionibacteriaceae bacterium]
MREALLSLLHKEPAHGYELKLAIESMFGELWPAVNIGQVYQTLSRLERQGLVQSATVTQESRPDKRVYELTPAGREALRRWVDEVVPAARLREGLPTVGGILSDTERTHARVRSWVGESDRMGEATGCASPDGIPVVPQRDVAGSSRPGERTYGPGRS